MEDPKVVFASNLIHLRNQHGMTQAELAERINYSDKSISKWERAEALPDVGVAGAIAGLFGVTVDYMLASHDAWEPPKKQRRFSAEMVTVVATLGIWSAALLLFVILWMLDIVVWQIFVYTLPVYLITLLVLNSLWHDRKLNLPIVMLLVASLFASLYCALLFANPWKMLLLLLPAELIVFFSFKIKTGLKRLKTKGSTRQ